MEHILQTTPNDSTPTLEQSVHKTIETLHGWDCNLYGYFKEQNKRHGYSISHIVFMQSRETATDFKL